MSKKNIIGLIEIFGFNAIAISAFIFQTRISIIVFGVFILMTYLFVRIKPLQLLLIKLYILIPFRKILYFLSPLSISIVIDKLLVENSIKSICQAVYLSSLELRKLHFFEIKTSDSYEIFHSLPTEELASKYIYIKELSRKQFVRKTFSLYITEKLSTYKQVNTSFISDHKLQEYFNEYLEEALNDISLYSKTNNNQKANNKLIYRILKIFESINENFENIQKVLKSYYQDDDEINKLYKELL